MVVVAQLVRAPDCGSGGRRFETDLPPRKTSLSEMKGFFCGTLLYIRNFKMFIKVVIQKKVELDKI